MFLFKIILLYEVFVTGLCGNVIDMDDILSEYYMPSALIMLENPKSSQNLNESVPIDSIGDGKLGTAVGTMGFHRSKMNEYLCRNYVAEQIVNDMTLARINRRMGPEPTWRSSKFLPSSKNQMLQDEGSKNYKDWLQKSATLEDIYRHYENNNRIDAQTEDKDDEINEDYDGQIAGFQQQQHPQQAQSPKLGHSGSGGSTIFISGAGGGGGFPSGGSYGHSSFGNSFGQGGHNEYGGHVIQEPEVHEQPKYQVYHHEGGGKDHDLADLFEIALTALAYLSFGMFIVHVVMCISAATSTATTTAAAMMMPMSMSPTGMSGGGMMTMGTGTGGDNMPATGNTGGGDADTNPDNTGTGDNTPDMGGDMDNTGGGDETDMENTNTGNTDMGNTDMGDTDMGDTDMGDTDMGDTDMGNTDMGNTDTGDTGMGDTDMGDTDTDNIGMGDGGQIDTGPPGTGTGPDPDVTGDDPNDETQDATDDEGRDPLKFRLKRQLSSNEDLNELARRVLASIEAAFVANDDNGNCLRQVLCENNKYSRQLEGKNKIFLPVWSLGMSWVSGRVSSQVNPATAMLDTLKASILGLGKGNCDILYQNCNLRSQKIERRRRRRRDAHAK